MTPFNFFISVTEVTRLPLITLTLIPTWLCTSPNLSSYPKAHLPQSFPLVSGAHVIPASEKNSVCHNSVYPNSLFIFLFFQINFYWRIVNLQCCVSFRHAAKWISYTDTKSLSKTVLSSSYSIPSLTFPWEHTSSATSFFTALLFHKPHACTMVLEMGTLLVPHWCFQTTPPPSSLTTFPFPPTCAPPNLKLSCFGPKP